MEGENRRSCVTDVTLSSSTTTAKDNSPDNVKVQMPEAASNRDTSPATMEAMDEVGGAEFTGCVDALLPEVKGFVVLRCLAVAESLEFPSASISILSTLLYFFSPFHKTAMLM